MAAPVPLRPDFDAETLRRLAKASRNPAQTRRLLALSAIYAGGSRTEAAAIGGVGLQTVRDWVLAFNAAGPDGLIDGQAAGARPRLNAQQQEVLRTLVEQGPTPAAHGVVRWRLVDFGPDPVRGARRVGLRADAEPGSTSHGLSQALGPSAPSCSGS